MSGIRLTQKDLLFGIYRGGKGSTNPGLNIWFNGRYVWPLKRRKIARPVKEATLFDGREPGDSGSEVTTA